MSNTSNPANETVAESASKKKRGRPGNILVGPDDRAIVAMVAEFNQNFFWVKNYGAKARACFELPSRVSKGKELVAQHPYDFKINSANDTIQVGVKPNGTAIVKNKAAVWIEHPGRRTYNKVVFEPGSNADPSVYNLWRGFAYPAVKGDCSLYLAHLQENVCQSDPVKYEYLIGWMAYAVRNPGEQGHVAIVVQGLKGVGKNVFAEGYANLWGPHGMVVSDQNRVTHNFNAHLRNKCVLVADEAFYAGDRRHEGVLKALITGNTLQIEAKGVNVETVPNLLRLIIIGNSPHLVRASGEERRFLVLRCSDAQRGNQKYFAAIIDQLEHGGYEALHYHLLHEVDLTNFNVRRAPHTEELREQMAESLNRIDSAWYECLYTGSIPGSVKEDGSVWLNGETFSAWATKKNRSRWDNISGRAVGMLLGDTVRGQQPGMGFPKAQEGEKRLRYWVVPSLAACRKRWNDVRFESPWPNDGEQWEDCRD